MALKLSLSKSQHAGVTINGLDNIRTRQCTGKESGRPGLNHIANAGQKSCEVQNGNLWEIPDALKSERNFNRAE